MKINYTFFGDRSKYYNLNNPRIDDAGIDLHNAEPIYLKNGIWEKVNTGIGIEIPKNHVGLITSRSGQRFNNGIFTSIGIIDSSYRGEIKILLKWEDIENKLEYIHIEPFTRVSQLIIIPFVQAELNRVQQLSSTNRGINGFGSTGE